MRLLIEFKGYNRMYIIQCIYYTLSITIVKEQTILYGYIFYINV